MSLPVILSILFSQPCHFPLQLTVLCPELSHQATILQVSDKMFVVYRSFHATCSFTGFLLRLISNGPNTKPTSAVLAL